MMMPVRSLLLLSAAAALTMASIDSDLRSLTDDIMNLERDTQQTSGQYAAADANVPTKSNALNTNAMCKQCKDRCQKAYEGQQKKRMECVEACKANQCQGKTPGTSTPAEYNSQLDTLNHCWNPSFPFSPKGSTYYQIPSDLPADKDWSGVFTQDFGVDQFQSICAECCGDKTPRVAHVEKNKDGGYPTDDFYRCYCTDEVEEECNKQVDQVKEQQSSQQKKQQGKQQTQQQHRPVNAAEEPVKPQDHPDKIAFPKRDPLGAFCFLNQAPGGCGTVQTEAACNRAVAEGECFDPLGAFCGDEKDAGFEGYQFFQYECKWDAGKCVIDTAPGDIPECDIFTPVAPPKKKAEPKKCQDATTAAACAATSREGYACKWAGGKEEVSLGLFDPAKWGKSLEREGDDSCSCIEDKVPVKPAIKDPFGVFV